MKIETIDNDQTLIIENEDDLPAFFEAYTNLRLRALPIAKELIKTETGKEPYLDEDDIHFEYGNLYAKYEVGCCGYYETEEMLIPSHYLFNDIWIAELREKQEQKRRAEQERKEREAKAAVERKARQEYEQYLKLKKQFEGEQK